MAGDTFSGLIATCGDADLAAKFTPFGSSATGSRIPFPRRPLGGFRLLRDCPLTTVVACELDLDRDAVSRSA